MSIAQDRLSIFNDHNFFIKGAGIDDNIGQKNFQLLSESGGNAIRTWNTRNAEAQFDSADKYNIKVALGIEVHQELHGFDYNDKKAVQKQFDEIKTKVLKYKDEPQLLCWVVGNELNLLFDDKGQLALVNPKVYDALEEIIQFIHSVDSIHPVTTTFAGIHPQHVKRAFEKTPSLDIISFQVYGDLMILQESVKKLNLTIPYMVTEYGAIGHWERPTTPWGRELEESSYEKGIGLQQRIQAGFVSNNAPLFLGSFAFYWGQKQERTPTWYGLFMKTGESDSRIDELTKYWSGNYPKNRAPIIKKLTLNNKNQEEFIVVQKGDNLTLSFEVSDFENDSISYKWEMLEEVKVKSQGGAYEKQPPSIPLTVLQQTASSITFSHPKKEGEYRIFAYVYDGKGKIGTANIPFYYGNSNHKQKHQK